MLVEWREEYLVSSCVQTVCEHGRLVGWTNAGSSSRPCYAAPQGTLPRGSSGQQTQ
jgi:hypothetical protein